MNRCLLMGLFAILLAFLVLWRILCEREDSRLLRLRRFWGRSHGLAFFFVANVALPLVVGIVFVARGVVAFNPGAGDVTSLSQPDPLRSLLPVPQVRLRSPLEPLFDFDLLVP